MNILKQLSFLCTFLVLGCQQPSVEDQLTRASNEIKTCPMEINADTRLLNTVLLPGRTFQYNYTLVNLTHENIDTAIFISDIIPTVKNSIRTNPDLKLWRDNEVNMAYNYTDKNGVFVYKFIVKPTDYK